MNTKLIALLAFGMLAMTVVVAPLAAADSSVDENVTALKRDIVSTLATWIPFVVLFTLLGLAMAAIGIHLFGRHA
jgi:hypothetical protein